MLRVKRAGATLARRVIDVFDESCVLVGTFTVLLILRKDRREERKDSRRCMPKTFFLTMADDPKPCNKNKIRTCTVQISERYDYRRCMTPEWDCKSQTDMQK